VLAGGSRNAVTAVIYAAVMTLGLATAADAHVGPTLSDYGTATVDGKIGASEYDGPQACTKLREEYASGRLFDFKICEMNDSTNMYVLLIESEVVPEPENGVYDTVSVLFDSRHDGTEAACTNGFEDWLTMDAQALALGDAYTCIDPSFGFTLNGASDTFDGTGAMTYKQDPNYPISYVFEMSHPLKTGQPYDYALDSHDTVGWCYVYNDSSASPVSALGQVDFPQGCFIGSQGSASGSTKRYADIYIKSPLDGTLGLLGDDYKAICNPCPNPVEEVLGPSINEAVRQSRVDHVARVVRMLRGFMREVRSFKADRQLPAAQANQLIRAAQNALAGARRQTR
jgi:hypothetical protein